MEIRIMAISLKSLGGGSGGGGGDFTLSVGATGNTTYVLERAYPSGSYELVFANGDTSFDIYAIAEDGTFAGYTNGGALEALADFTKVVVLGAANGESIIFTYKGAITTSSTIGDVSTAGAFISEVVTSALPGIDDTTVINGGNFAEDVEVIFIDQGNAESFAKNVVRSSSTQIIVTRPDSFSPDDSPYTVKVVNLGIPEATGSNASILSNSVTAGTHPVWSTASNIYYNIGGHTDIALLATDTEATDIDYSIVSGTLPAGISLDTETGVISGTFSGSASANDVTALTFRATDTGGNFLDKAIAMIANTAPIINSGTNLYFIPDQTTSAQLDASSAVVQNTLTYSLVSGSILTGTTLGTTGRFAGTNTASQGSSSSATIRVSDEHGLFAEKTFSIQSSAPMSGGVLSVSGGYAYHTFVSSGTLTISSPTAVEYLIVGGGGYGGNPNSQGGGGGSVYANAKTLSIGTTYATVGSQNGGNSSFEGKTANGASGNTSGTPDSGGIISSFSYSPGVNTYGSNGSQQAQGGGGGAGGRGGDASYRSGGTGGSGVSWVNGLFYGGGGGGSTTWYQGGSYRQGSGGSSVGGGVNGDPLANRGGGGSTGDSTGITFDQNGAAGVVVVRYPN
jgi:hypothetical protein